MNPLTVPHYAVRRTAYGLFNVLTFSELQIVCHPVLLVHLSIDHCVTATAGSCSRSFCFSAGVCCVDNAGTLSPVTLSVLVDLSRPTLHNLTH